MTTLAYLLQNRDGFIQDIVERKDLRSKLKQLLIISSICFGLYGVILGTQHSAQQAISSMVKLPILFLLTVIICMPALYIFSSLFGSKRSALQTFVLLLSGTCTMGIALVGLAPVTLFFIITTHNYQFFKLLNVFFFLAAGLLGILLVNRFHRGFPEEDEETRQARSTFLRLWYLLYAFVGTQLAWTLRPFFGDPDLPFQVVRDFGGNFYANVIASVAHLLGG